MWRVEPVVAGVEPGEEGHSQDHALDEVLARFQSCLVPVERVLRRIRLRVVETACVPDAETLENRRPVAEPLQILDVLGILVPKDELRVLLEPADPLVELAGGHGANSGSWPLEDRY